MPELPEVEIMRRGLAPLVTGKTVAKVIRYTLKLRWLIPSELISELPGATIIAVERRGKYLILRTDKGNVIFHFGMTGHLQYIAEPGITGIHDHLDIVLDDGACLRFKDPRRFGAVFWTREEPNTYPLLSQLGPEPGSPAFSASLLFARSRRKSVAVKIFIMDGKVVAGIGNMYANEALFRAGIVPERKAGELNIDDYSKIAKAIIETLDDALRQGELSLQEGAAKKEVPGYFAVNLQIYGHGGEGCPACGALIKHVLLGQRSTYFCPRCQI